MSETFVVVGGDAAGMSAASEAGREGPELDVVVERGEWVSDVASGLPYYATGEVEDVADLVAVQPRLGSESRGGERSRRRGGA